MIKDDSMADPISGSCLSIYLHTFRTKVNQFICFGQNYQMFLKEILDYPLSIRYEEIWCKYIKSEI